MIDSRFLNLNLFIKGIRFSEPSSSNAQIGDTYLLLGTENSDNNDIIVFDGSSFHHIPPRTTMHELIDAENGNIYSYDGSNWNISGHIGDMLVESVIDFFYSSSEDEVKFRNIAGVKYIQDNYLYTSTGEGTNADSQELSQGAYIANNTDGRIYYYEGYDDNSHYVWIPCKLGISSVVISKATGAAYYYNGTAWVALTSLLKNEMFTLDYQNIQDKRVNLSSNVASEKASSVIVFAGGATHFAGTDFSVTGNSISWNAKVLDTVGLKEGDKLIVQYVGV